MKLISYSSAVALALITAPVTAWADANPDFDDDAKPILKVQPGLIQYVQSHFQVKDTGTAKYPGDDDRRPIPPYIFRARPIGSSGPYNLRLLIQPGPPGHILNVVDMNKVRVTEPGSPPAVASQPPSPPESAYAPEPPAPPRPPTPPPESAYAPEPPATPQTPTPPPASNSPAPAAPSAPASEPTADTPSGPIMGTGDSSSNLTPPPDPAPPAQ
jgi:hypothetical protein